MTDSYSKPIFKTNIIVKKTRQINQANLKIKTIHFNGEYNDDISFVYLITLNY